MNEQTPVSNNRVVDNFWKYHAANPELLETIERYAHELVDSRSCTRYGMQMVLERVRWHMVVDTKRTDEFKINNDHAACYSRMVMMRNPSLYGFFGVRVSDADQLVWNGETWLEFEARMINARIS